MKKLIFLLLLPCFANATTYYVSPTGADNNPGTLASPFKNWDKLSSIMVQGDNAFIRGGTYSSHYANNSSFHCYFNGMTGTALLPITISNYPNEIPILDLGSVTPLGYSDPIGMYLADCAYLHLIGLKVTYLKQIADGSGISRGVTLARSQHCTLENIEIFNIGGPGLTIEFNSNDNLILNCDFHHCGDGLSSRAWDNSDGTDCSTGGDFSTRNVYRDCRAYLNADDGFDTFNSNSFTTFDGCWSFWNGVKPWGTTNLQVTPSQMTPSDYSWHGNPSYYSAADASGEGFKLGVAASQNFTLLTRLLTNCVAFENRGTGYASNSLLAVTCLHRLYNCIAYKNDNDGFSYGAGWDVGASQNFKNCWSWNNNQAASGADWVYDGNNNAGISNNVWMSTYGGVNYGNLYPSTQVSNADFLSVSSVGMAAPRQADGSLPSNNFLKLKSTSGLRNKGVDVGLPYCDATPDLGAFQYCGLPTVNVGSDRPITLPVNSVSFTPTVSGATSYLWKEYLGGVATITSPTTANTTIGNLVSGTYGFSLTVTNATGSITDSVSVVVSNAAATNPTCSAGTTPVSISLPQNMVALTGTGASTNGNTVSFAWTQTAGTSVTLANANTANATATFTIAGNYSFLLTVTDNVNGLICTSSKSVTVTAAVVPPTANAGSDQIITLPTNQVTVSATGTGGSGTVTSYSWVRVTGSSYNITDPSSPTTTITGLVAGVYKFRVIVTASTGLVAKDTMQITVNQTTNTPPTCSSGTSPVSITLPTNQVALSATGASTNTGGFISSYMWTQTSGATVPITNANAANAIAIFSTAGSYSFDVLVTDNVALTCTSSKSVTVTTPVINLPPVVICNTDFSASLPFTIFSIGASVVVPSGTLTSLNWVALDGGTITTPTQLISTVSGITTAGKYRFVLTANSSIPLTGKDTITVTVQQSTTANGIRWLSIYLYPDNSGRGDMGWDFIAKENPNVQYLIGQMKQGDGIFASFGNKILPKSGTKDYWTFFDLKGKPRGIYYFRVGQIASDGTTYSNVISVLKKK